MAASGPVCAQTTQQNGVTIVRPAGSGGVPSGTVTSGTQTPFLKKAIGLGYVASAHAAPGTELEIDIRGRRVKAVVVRTPFYKRTR